jgi:hypothetical protein
MIRDTATIEEARGWLRERASKGERCPCCRQFVKVHRRKLNRSMTRWLVRFHALTSGSLDWTDTRKFTELVFSHESPGGLVYWGLMEPHPEKSRLWRETQLGAEFVRMQTDLPSHAVVYDNRVLRLDGELVGVLNALGDFEYAELMNERPITNQPQ